MPGEQTVQPQPGVPPEFDEATLIAAGKLLVQLGRHPDTGRPLRKLVKKVDPTRTFPADDVRDLREEIADDNRKRDEKAAHDRAIAAQEAERAQVAQRYTAEEMKEIEAIMTKAGIASYEIGEELYLSRRKPVSSREQVASEGRTWSLPSNDGLFENPSKWATDEAVKVIDEIKHGVFRG
jgi:hypothetical protein